jgi:hypothetical protein
MTWSGRMSKPPTWLIVMMAQCHLDTRGHDKTEYSLATVQVIARVMCKFNDLCTNSSQKEHSFIETFSLKAGLKWFGPWEEALAVAAVMILFCCIRWTNKYRFQ